MKNNKFLELAEFFADHYGWECVGENQQVSTYEKTFNGKKARLNIYPNGTVHPVTGKSNKKSFKKCSDMVLENLFADPYKNPLEPSAKPKPITGLLDRMAAMEKRIADLEQAFIDKHIIFGGEEPVF